MTCHINFSDVNAAVAVSFKSVWQTSGTFSDAECQTPKELFQFSETEMQSGIATQVVQDQVKSKHDGMTLLDYYCKLHPERTREEWKKEIGGGKVTVDCEVTTKSDSQLQTDFFLEYVNVGSEKETQTTPIDYSASCAPSSSSSSSSRSRSRHRGRGEGKGSDEEADDGEDYKDQFDDYGEGKNDEDESSRKLASSLRRLSALVEEELTASASSRAFDGYQLQSSANTTDNEVAYWKCLSVDLEKKKVVFPDWTKATHFTGRVVRCLLSRNRERLYDVEFDDGGVQLAVREEHIRIVGELHVDRESESKSGGGSGSSAPSRIQEGIRVHAKVASRKNQPPKFLPGRVVKAIKGGRYDVECEGGVVQRDLPAEDIVIGILEGQSVEARRPAKVNLQATGVSWNVTGSTLATSYGRTDIAGWCDAPGAVCVWNVFGKSFECDNPDYVLDHPSCLLCVAFHPLLPAIVAAGSFNGEVVVWDLASAEQTPLVSPIAEQVHKEPVVDLKWVRDGSDDWLLCSAGADGKLLFWSLDNALRHPVMGALLSKGKTSATRRQYPPAHGATSVAFAGGPTASSRPPWVLCGQEAGGIARGQMARLHAAPRVTADSFKSAQTSASSDGLYGPLNRADEVFSHEAHSGPVCSVDFSPHSRNLFLTSGGDGTVRLYHLLEATPLRMWEPSPPPSASHVPDTFTPLTRVQFSPTRPLVFATASASGFLYIFDLLASENGPVETLECPAASSSASAMEQEGTRGRKSGGGTRGGGGERRPGFSCLAFNKKQRGLLAACDVLGRVHIWQLGFSLSSRTAGEGEAASLLDGASQEH